MASQIVRLTLGGLLWGSLVLSPLAGRARADDVGGRPAYLEGLDLSVPAFETFRGWPQPSLTERLYRLPWSRLAFRRAALFGRPVLFVLTVDWARSAQRLVTETLADPEVLRLINRSYITIGVNADLRPDIRERYQTGGWPAIAFLLPGGEPMLSHVNDPSKSVPITTGDGGKESLLFLLREGVTYWNLRADRLVRAGERWARQEGPVDPIPGTVNATASEQVAVWLMGNADREDGGFGLAPKFILPGLEEYAGIRDARSLPALRSHSSFTLEQLIGSPLFDSREGGMHRMAAAPSFGNVQYEKMLTGNASLVRELVYSLRRTDSESLRGALRKTVEFMLRTLARPERGFFLAQSADPASADGGAYWRGDREGQPPPIDELVLSGPNAMAGAALLRAGSLLNDPELVRAGSAALELVLEEAFQRGRGVAHAIVPSGQTEAYLGSLADVALAFTDAYETTGESRYLAAARDIVDFARYNLKSTEHPTYRDRLEDPRAMGLLRNERRPLKPNVRLARAMLRLGLHRAGEEYGKEAKRILAAYAGDLSSFGVHATEAALAIEEVVAVPLLVRISGAAQDERTVELRRAAVNSPLSWTVVVTAEDSESAEPGAEVRWGGDSRQVTRPERMRSTILELVGEAGS